MKIKIEKAKDMVIIKLIGCLNYEKIDPFHQACLKHLSEKKVIFNLEKLNFVGSSGITSFLDMMVSLLKINKEGIRLCCVGSEFRRIFETSPLKDLELYESEVKAQLSFEKMESPSFSLSSSSAEGQDSSSELSSSSLLIQDESKKKDAFIIQSEIKEDIIDN